MLTIVWKSVMDSETALIYQRQSKSQAVGDDVGFVLKQSMYDKTAIR